MSTGKYLWVCKIYASIWAWLLYSQSFQYGDRREILMPTVTKMMLDEAGYSSKTHRDRNQNLLPEVGCIFLEYVDYSINTVDHQDRFQINSYKKEHLRASESDDLSQFESCSFSEYFCKSQARCQILVVCSLKPLPAQSNAHWRHDNINTLVWGKKRTWKKKSKSEEVSTYNCLQILALRVKATLL